MRKNVEYISRSKEKEPKHFFNLTMIMLGFLTQNFQDRKASVSQMYTKIGLSRQRIATSK